jgi:hypothetical protein
MASNPKANNSAPMRSAAVAGVKSARKCCKA